MTNELETWCDISEEGTPVWFYVVDYESIGPFPTEEAAIVHFEESRGIV